MARHMLKTMLLAAVASGALAATAMAQKAQNQTTPVSPPTAPSQRAAGTQEERKAPAFTAVREPIYYGPDVQAAYDNVLQLQEPQNLLAELSPAAADRARAALRETLGAHDTGDGVLFDSAAWIVEAM